MYRKAFLVMSLLIISAGITFAQKSISGFVKTITGEPVAGAFVSIEQQREGSSKNGAISLADGSFTITDVPQGATTLTASCLGMKTVSVNITSSPMNIIMEDDALALDQVVVTAQGLTRKEKSLGYSTVQIKGEDLSMSRQTDITQSLAGKVAGARFFSSSGATFSEGTIVLRGTSSYTSRAGSEPIYVVDGTITNKNAVNMDDIANVNILKGPAATALYGSQGGNGAVIITTKPAKGSDSRIEVSHTIAMETYYNHFQYQKLYGGGSLGRDGAREGNDASVTEDTMSAAYLFGKYAGKNEDGSYYMDYGSDENWGPRFDESTLVANALYYDETSPWFHKAEPWKFRLDLHDLYRTGWTNTTNVAFSKAGKGFSTRISFTNSDRSGIQYNSNATRRYLTAKATLNPKDWLKIDLDYKFTYRKNKNAANEGYGANRGPICEYTQWGQTNVDLSYYKDYERPDGSWRSWNITDPTDLRPTFHDNPYAVMYTRNDYDTYLWNVITGDAEASLPLNIKAGFRFMGNIRNYHGEHKYSEGSVNYESYYGESQNHITDLTFQGRLTWSDTFVEDRLGVETAAFIEQRDYDYGVLSGNTSSGLSINDYFNLNSSSGSVVATNSITKYKTRSVFGNATVSFDDTYFLDLSLRNDWDSRLPSSKNSYLYGGVSASVMLSQFINAKWLNFWKLRASIAQVGSTLDAYQTTYTYNAQRKYNTTATLRQSLTQLNQQIKPTISTSYEVGTEFRMFKNMLRGDINFYRRDSKNQILNVTVAPQSGYSSRQLNAGLIRNQGIEISLGGTIVNTRNFSWDIDANVSKNVNKLVKLNDDITEYSLGWNRFYYAWGIRSIVGKPVGEFYTASRWKRNDDGQLILSKTTSAQWGGGWQPIMETNVEKYVGNFQPDFTGGFSTQFRFKSLTLGASFDFQVGGSIASWTNLWGEGSGLIKSTASVNDNGVNVREPIAKGGGVHVTGVDEDGNSVDCYMNAYRYYSYKAMYDNDSWVYGRTYVKMRELSVGYDIPSAFLSRLKIGLSQASVSFIATNPWLIYSAIPNIDPSESSTNYIEGGQAPSTRSFGLTVKLTF